MKLPEHDQRTAMHFMAAAGILLARPTHRDTMNERLNVIFTLSQVGFVGRRDLSRTVREQRRDIVHLEFKPWHEVFGPMNVIVCEGRGPTPRYWPECSIWMPSPEGPASIVPHGAKFSFAFDGLDLSRVPGAPEGEELTEGAALASAVLITMAPKVPPELLGGTLQ